MIEYYYQSYDALGNVINHTLPDGNQLGYLYYGSGHLSQLNFKTPTAMYDIAEYERDRLHREISRRQGKLTQRITFDALGRMTSKRTAFNDLGSHALPLIDKRFDYDKVGNLIQQVNGYGNYPTQTLDSRARYSQRYEYDAAQQVVMQREYTDQQHFVYDPAGNLFNEQGDVCRANQLRQYNGYHYDYDDFGRLIKRQRPAENITQWFSYNHEHQLIEARVESLQHRSITRYQYDALGRRINKTTEHYDKYSQRYTTTGTDFSWQGMRLSGEANAQQQIRYLYNGQGYEPIARAISDRYPKTSDVHYQIEYFHTLANSLPTELTNEEGEIIWLGEYTLFGQLKHQRNRDRWYNPDKTEQNLRFAGQYYDQETGLHYNTLRYYDPNCGRFTQQDPIGLAGGINLYRYAPNSHTYVDPLGLVALNAPGYTVYGLYKKGATEPYYIGITNDVDRRADEHRRSGRLDPESEMRPIEENLIYGEARGSEQYNIEKHKTRTGKIGEEISSTNQGNKYNSFNHDRTDSRAAAFKKAYNDRVKKGRGGC